MNFETILKYHGWYLCQISRTNHAIICLYYYALKVCNFHMQVFRIKLKYNCSKPIKLQKFLMQQFNIRNCTEKGVVAVHSATPKQTNDSYVLQDDFTPSTVVLWQERKKSYPLLSAASFYSMSKKSKFLESYQLRQNF